MFKLLGKGRNGHANESQNISALARRDSAENDDNPAVRGWGSWVNNKPQHHGTFGGPQSPRRENVSTTNAFSSISQRSQKYEYGKKIPSRRHGKLEKEEEYELQMREKRKETMNDFDWYESYLVNRQRSREFLSDDEQYGRLLLELYQSGASLQTSELKELKDMAEKARESTEGSKRQSNDSPGPGKHFEKQRKDISELSEEEMMEVEMLKQRREDQEIQEYLLLLEMQETSQEVDADRFLLLELLDKRRCDEFLTDDEMEILEAYDARINEEYLDIFEMKFLVRQKQRSKSIDEERLRELELLRMNRQGIALSEEEERALKEYEVKRRHEEPLVSSKQQDHHQAPGRNGNSDEEADARTISTDSNFPNKSLGRNELRKRGLPSIIDISSAAVFDQSSVSIGGLSGTSYIEDLLGQKQNREAERNEEAYQEALGLYEVLLLGGNQSENEVLFTEIYTKILEEHKQKFKELDRIADERLDREVKAHESLKREKEKTKDILGMSQRRNHTVEDMSRVEEEKCERVARLGKIPAGGKSIADVDILKSDTKHQNVNEYNNQRFDDMKTAKMKQDDVDMNELAEFLDRFDKDSDVDEDRLNELEIVARYRDGEDLISEDIKNLEYLMKEMRQTTHRPAMLNGKTEKVVDKSFTDKSQLDTPSLSLGASETKPMQSEPDGVDASILGETFVELTKEYTSENGEAHDGKLTLSTSHHQVPNDDPLQSIDDLVPKVEGQQVVKTMGRNIETQAVFIESNLSLFSDRKSKASTSTMNGEKVAASRVDENIDNQVLGALNAATSDPHDIIYRDFEGLVPAAPSIVFDADKVPSKAEQVKYGKALNPPLSIRTARYKKRQLELKFLGMKGSADSAALGKDLAKESESDILPDIKHKPKANIAIDTGHADESRLYTSSRMRSGSHEMSAMQPESDEAATSITHGEIFSKLTKECTVDNGGHERNLAISTSSPRVLHDDLLPLEVTTIDFHEGSKPAEIAQIGNVAKRNAILERQQVEYKGVNEYSREKISVECWLERDADDPVITADTKSSDRIDQSRKDYVGTRYGVNYTLSDTATERLTNIGDQTSVLQDFEAMVQASITGINEVDVLPNRWKGVALSDFESRQTQIDEDDRHQAKKIPEHVEAGHNVVPKYEADVVNAFAVEEVLVPFEEETRHIAKEVAVPVEAKNSIEETQQCVDEEITFVAKEEIVTAEVKPHVDEEAQVPLEEITRSITSEGYELVKDETIERLELSQKLRRGQPVDECRLCELEIQCILSSGLDLTGEEKYELELLQRSNKDTKRAPLSEEEEEDLDYFLEKRLMYKSLQFELEGMRKDRERSEDMNGDLLFELELFEKRRLRKPLDKTEMFALDLLERNRMGESLSDEDMDNLLDVMEDIKRSWSSSKHNSNLNKENNMETIPVDMQSADLAEEALDKAHYDNADYEVNLFKRNRKGLHLDEDEKYELELFGKRRKGENLSEEEVIDLQLMAEQRSIQEKDLLFLQEDHKNGVGVDLKLLYELQLFHKKRRGVLLNDDQQLAIEIYTRRRNGDILTESDLEFLELLQATREEYGLDKAELLDLQSRKNRGELVDESLLHDLELSVRDRDGENLSKDEHFELLCFEKQRTGKELQEEEEEELLRIKRRRLMGDDAYRAQIEEDEDLKYLETLENRRRQEGTLTDEEYCELCLIQKRKNGRTLEESELVTLKALRLVRHGKNDEKYFLSKDKKKRKKKHDGARIRVGQQGGKITDRSVVANAPERHASLVASDVTETPSHIQIDTMSARKPTMQNMLPKENSSLPKQRLLKDIFGKKKRKEYKLEQLRRQQGVLIKQHLEAMDMKDELLDMEHTRNKQKELIQHSIEKKHLETENKKFSLSSWESDSSEISNSDEDPDSSSDIGDNSHSMASSMLKGRERATNGAGSLQNPGNRYGAMSVDLKYARRPSLDPVSRNAETKGLPHTQTKNPSTDSVLGRKGKNEPSTSRFVKKTFEKKLSSTLTAHLARNSEEDKINKHGDEISVGLAEQAKKGTAEIKFRNLHFGGDAEKNRPWKSSIESGDTERFSRVMKLGSITEEEKAIEKGFIEEGLDQSVYSFDSKFDTGVFKEETNLQVVEEEKEDSSPDIEVSSQSEDDNSEIVESGSVTVEDPELTHEKQEQATMAPAKLDFTNLAGYGVQGHESKLNEKMKTKLNFDKTWNLAEADKAAIAKFNQMRFLRERGRQKKKQKVETEEIPRLFLFEGEKLRNKKKAKIPKGKRKQKKLERKLSREFRRAMENTFDSDSEDEYDENFCDDEGDMAATTMKSDRLGFDLVSLDDTADDDSTQSHISEASEDEGEFDDEGECDDDYLKKLRARSMQQDVKSLLYEHKGPLPQPKNSVTIDNVSQISERSYGSSFRSKKRPKSRSTARGPHGSSIRSGMSYNTFEIDPADVYAKELERTKERKRFSVADLRKEMEELKSSALTKSFMTSKNDPTSQRQISQRPKSKMLEQPKSRKLDRNSGLLVATIGGNLAVPPTIFEDEASQAAFLVATKEQELKSFGTFVKDKKARESSTFSKFFDSTTSAAVHQKKIGLKFKKLAGKAGKIVEKAGKVSFRRRDQHQTRLDDGKQGLLG